MFTRLLFFNGRRPAEIVNLTIDQWSLAKNNDYITEQRKSDLRRCGISLEDMWKLFRVTVTIGKSDDVSVIIPHCLYEAIDYLTKSRI